MEIFDTVFLSVRVSVRHVVYIHLYFTTSGRQ